MIEWNDSLATGHEMVDHDHQQLIKSLNELEVALQQGASEEHLLEILSFLICYANEHFAREEALMERVQCPVRAGNCQAHAKLRVRLGEWVQLLKKPGAPEHARMIYTELSAWITDHILKIDCRLRQCHEA